MTREIRNLPTSQFNLITSPPPTPTLQNGANIRMHFVAMIFQLLGNFALLNELDQKLSTHVPGIPTVGGVPINFTTTTAFGW